MKMKTRYALIAALMGGSLTAAAQETYMNAELATGDLNGTARYVGMGGAMDALGADLSTIGTNPAGIGLFRHSTASASFGFVSQQDAVKFADANKTNMSFDQIGFVYSMRTSSRSFINFAFNYHKSRNFNFILNAAGNLGADASQNKASYNKGAAAANSGWDFVYPDNGYITSGDNAFSQLDELYYNALLVAPGSDMSNPTYGYFGAERYMMDRKNSGYIGSYDFNISGNINDRVYLGVTIGLHDVHYKGYSEYAELFAPNEEQVDGVLVEDTREITGSGVDVKAGVIFRPIEESPFRIGLSVATPTWYDLTTRNYTAMVVDDKLNGQYSMDISNEYDFKLYTPWKFGLSLGHTIDRYLALGASYEYADYGSTDSRIIDGYDWDGYEDTSSDREMNRHTEKMLKGVHTVKVGAEFKPDNDISVRLGFNYLSPMYNKNAVKDGWLDSYGVSYASSTDYTNWKDTYRITAGIGYRIDKFSIDLAYQYSQTNGTFRPFSDVLDATNTADAADVSNKRHQMLLSLGYTF